MGKTMSLGTDENPLFKKMDNNPIIIKSMDIPVLPALNSFCLS